MTRRKDGTWQEKISVTLPDGTKKLKYFYGKTKSDVLRKIREYQTDQDNGPIFRAVAEKWQEARESEVRYKTSEAYRAPLKRLCNQFGDRYIKDISAPEIASYIREFGKLGYSKRTVQQTLDVMRMICRYAIADLGAMQSNPCEAVSVPRNLTVTHRSLPSEADIKAVFAHADDDRFSLLPFVLCCTGLRLGEALALTDKDFCGDHITIRKKVSWQPNQPVVDSFLKTEKGARDVPYLDILRAHIPEFKGFLFSDDGKTPYSKSAFTKRWRKYAVATGVSCDRHTLRHHFSTIMYDADVDTKEAADIMGHDEKVMREIYTHITDSRRQSTISKLNNYLNSM